MPGIKGHRPPTTEPAPICDECGADLSPDDGGAFGRHDYGCSRGPWPTMSGAEWMRRHHVAADVRQIDSRPDGPFADPWHDGATHWRVTFRLTTDDQPTRRAVVFYSQGAAYEGKAPEPGAVLECVASDLAAGAESFSDFCASFGYDDDSRRAFATWEAVKAQRAKFLTFCAHIGGTSWDDLETVQER